MMRVAVSLITAPILFLSGVLWMLLMFFGGGYGNDAGDALPGLIPTSALLLITIGIAGVVSAWLAHVLQTRSGISPWLVGPGAVVAVTAVGMIAMFLGVPITAAVVDSVVRRPPPRQPPAVNRRY